MLKKQLTAVIKTVASASFDEPAFAASWEDLCEYPLVSGRAQTVELCEQYRFDTWSAQIRKALKGPARKTANFLRNVYCVGAIKSILWMGDLGGDLMVCVVLRGQEKRCRLTMWVGLGDYYGPRPKASWNDHVLGQEDLGFPIPFRFAVTVREIACLIPRFMENFVSEKTFLNGAKSYAETFKRQHYSGSSCGFFIFDNFPVVKGSASIVQRQSATEIFIATERWFDELKTTSEEVRDTHLWTVTTAYSASYTSSTTSSQRVHRVAGKRKGEEIVVTEEIVEEKSVEVTRKYVKRTKHVSTAADEEPNQEEVPSFSASYPSFGGNSHLRGHQLAREDVQSLVNQHGMMLVNAAESRIVQSVQGDVSALKQQLEETKQQTADGEQRLREEFMLHLQDLARKNHLLEEELAQSKQQLALTSQKMSVLQTIMEQRTKAQQRFHADVLNKITQQGQTLKQQQETLIKQAAHAASAGPPPSGRQLRSSKATDKDLESLKRYVETELSSRFDKLRKDVKSRPAADGEKLLGEIGSHFAKVEQKMTGIILQKVQAQLLEVAACSQEKVSGASLEAAFTAFGTTYTTFIQEWFTNQFQGVGDTWIAAQNYQAQMNVLPQVECESSPAMPQVHFSTGILPQEDYEQGMTEECMTANGEALDSVLNFREIEDSFRAEWRPAENFDIAGLYNFSL